MLRIIKNSPRQIVGGLLLSILCGLFINADSLDERLSVKQQYRSLRKEFAPYTSKFKNNLRYYSKGTTQCFSAICMGILAGRLVNWKLYEMEAEAEAVSWWEWASTTWEGTKYLVKNPFKSIVAWKGKKFLKANVSFASTALVSILFYLWLRSHSKNSRKICLRVLTNFVRKWPAYQQTTPEEFKFFFNGLYETYLNNNGRLFFSEEESFAILCEVVADIDKAAF